VFDASHTINVLAVMSNLSYVMSVSINTK